MKEQKNIERLFQEKFKDFEVAPPEMAWKNIEARLEEKKKKRRIIPFWFKASGIAASLILGFFIYSLFIKPSNVDLKTDDNSIVVDDKNNSIPNQSDAYTIEKNENNNTVLDNENSVLTEIDNSNKAAISSESDKDNNPNTFKNKKQKNTYFETEENILTASNSIDKDKIKINTNPRYKENSIFSNHKIVEFDKNNDESKNSDLIKNEIDFNKINKLSNDKNSSIVVKEKTSMTTQDSSLVSKISEEVNELEQLLKEKEVGKNVEEKEKEMQNRWAVSSNASPVYFNSTSKNSTLDTKFDSNEKGYNSNLSYGLGVSYAINKKISIRTGINTLNFNSNTNDILFYQRNNPVPIDNLSRNKRGDLINIENKPNDNLKEVGFNGGELVKYNGNLSQKLGYVEVPLELSYKLIDKRFAIDVIGGMSTLFLNNNSVSIISNDMEMEIGSATNLNNIHYSTNFGMGFSYTFLKSFQANINPMFKYQLNTYTDNSNNIKPYFIGIYSGISFKF